MSFWETNRTHIVTIGSVAVIMAAASSPWWYGFAQHIDTIEAAKVVYNCFCKTIIDTVAPSCQQGLDTLYGAGVAPSNITIFCDSSGSLARVKSVAVKAAIGGCLGGCFTLAGGAFLIGKYIRDVRNLQRGYQQIA